VLGERLFSDRRLSHDNTHSCSSCHDVRTNGASANAHDVTPDGRLLPLNTPTIFNAALNFRLNWAGGFRSFERHAEQTLRNREIMASSVDEVVSKLRGDPEAVRQFRDAYDRDPDVAALLDAIATYERSLVTPGSRFDRWLGAKPPRSRRRSCPAMSCSSRLAASLVMGFGCRPRRASPHAPGPASESRQGTKPREMGHPSEPRALWGIGWLGACDGGPVRRTMTPRVSAGASIEALAGIESWIGC